MGAAFTAFLAAFFAVFLAAFFAVFLVAFFAAFFAFFCGCSEFADWVSLMDGSEWV